MPSVKSRRQPGDIAAPILLVMEFIAARTFRSRVDAAQGLMEDWTMFSRLRARLKFGSLEHRLRVLLTTIATRLGPDYAYLVDLLSSVRHLHLQGPSDARGFRFIAMSVSPSAMRRVAHHRRINIKIAGILARTATGGVTELALELRRGFPIGLRVDNDDYGLVVMTPTEVDVSRVTTEILAPEQDAAERAWLALPSGVQGLLELTSLDEVEVEGRPMFAFHDLEDGNFLAFDEQHRVWSVVHDADPVACRMNESIGDLLQSIACGAFDSVSHVEVRGRRG